jgi:mannosyltransferase OCH1-like enzyme/GT2 family glycosyltransferase
MSNSNLNSSSVVIPKIIHQLWIGPKPRPSKFMATWQTKHPDYEYIMWNEEEIIKRCLHLECVSKINEIEEINGKADIIRWEILYHYGGLFVDADSICIEPFNYLIEQHKPFCGYENENVRQGLVATGTMAFPKNHPLPRGAIDYIKANEVSRAKTGKMAWRTVGPELLTKLLQTNLFSDVVIYPSYYFLPKHATGMQYMGHSIVYAYQEWGSTKQNYEIMNSIELEDIYKEPKNWVSVLVSSYNTNHKYVVECLESIKIQNGHYGIELVWINDGSNELSTKLLEKTLDEFKAKMRFVKIVYKKWPTNKGIGYSLNKGIEMCSNEIIIKVDSDDMCLPDRFIKQIEFMRNNLDCAIVGCNAHYLKEIDNAKVLQGSTNHPYLLTWADYKRNPSHWFVNHPCVCYRKSAVLAIGNYNEHTHSLYEDFELELKLLKHFGKLYNIQENLLYYRIHANQVTANNSCSKPEVVNARNDFIKKLLLD